MSADGGKKEPMSFREVMSKAAASAARGGTAGAVAMGANVACLMWMRTTVRDCEYEYELWYNVVVVVVVGIDSATIHMDSTCPLWQ